MYQMSVVIAQKEPRVAERLAHALRARFRNVAIAHSNAELHDAIAKGRARAAIVDLELVKLKELRELCEDFRGTAVVATHRAPDEQMWKSCMEDGAADCCHPEEIDVMLRAIVSSAPISRAHAA
ncbi:MAG TPA: hypothetical protein VGL89_19095 [Candidatus Koribacter sp.]|jgi:DNA-binding NarL/FixJ family response regulator